MVVTTAVVGGRAALVTIRLLGPRLLLAPQIPMPRQQQMTTGIIIGNKVHTRMTTTTPIMIPVTGKKVDNYTSLMNLHNKLFKQIHESHLMITVLWHYIAGIRESVVCITLLLHYRCCNVIHM